MFYCDGMERMHVDLDKPWLTVADICEYMDVSTFVVTSVLRSGELPAVKYRAMTSRIGSTARESTVHSSQLTVRSRTPSAVNRRRRVLLETEDVN